MMAPTLSIGMPVFNGARYLQEAIESLLTQTFVDFELIISDNASTDPTREICLENARRDSRIRYVRQSHNVGGPRNWNFVAEEACGRYFKWASANDLHDRKFVERCLNLLDEDRQIVLCYADTMLIDEHGVVLFAATLDQIAAHLKAHDGRKRSELHHRRSCVPCRFRPVAGP